MTDRTGADRTGTDRTGADRAGADRAGADRAGADRAGTDRTGADRAGADRAGADRVGVPPDDFESRARRRVVELADDIDLDAFAAMFDLFRVSARLIGDLENTVHRPIGLSTAGFRVLFTVWVHGSLEPREIARLSGVSRAAVSGVVKTLERDGFATRRRDQTDGRLVTVSLTPAGVAKLREAYRLQHARERAVFAALSDDEVAQFTSTMRTLLAARPDGGHDGEGSRRDS